MAAVYATVDQLKTRFSNKTDTKDDTALGEVLTAAEFKIEAFCNRSQDGFLADTSASAREYTGTGLAYQWIDECVEVSSVAVKTTTQETSYTAWASTDWRAASGHPARPNWSKTPYRLIIILPTGSKTSFLSGKLGQIATPTVQVSSKWGYAAAGSRALELVREACIAQALRWFQRLKSGFSDTLAGPEFSTLLYRQSLDPDIKDMLVNGKLVREAMAEGIPI